MIDPSDNAVFCMTLDRPFSLVLLFFFFLYVVWKMKRRRGREGKEEGSVVSPLCGRYLLSISHDAGRWTDEWCSCCYKVPTQFRLFERRSSPFQLIDAALMSNLRGTRSLMPVEKTFFYIDQAQIFCYRLLCTRLYNRCSLALNPVDGFEVGVDVTGG